MRLKKRALIILLAAMTAVACGCKSDDEKLTAEQTEVTQQGSDETTQEIVKTESKVVTTEVVTTTEDPMLYSEQPLELVDYGWYINEGSAYGNTNYTDYVGIIHNPNKTLIAEYPKVIVTVKGEDGSILGTSEQVGSVIMPGDTVTICGTLSMPGDLDTTGAMIYFDADCSSFTGSNSFYDDVWTSDYEFTNVNEMEGEYENQITGEVTNHSAYDVKMTSVSIVLRKDGNIVYMENTFVDNIRSGETKAFKFERYHDWPEHDKIECSAMAWY